MCPLVEGKHYLDVGTGNGYVAFALAKQAPDIFVIGIDIVQKAIAANNQKAKSEQLHNLKFFDFNGANLPFDASKFFGIVSRYAFHHFPSPEWSVREMARVLEVGGFCVIADPIPNTQDETDFINSYMALKDDGHVRFYRPSELESLFGRAGFQIEEQFFSSITFPRPMTADYQRLLAETSTEILQAYRIQINGDQIHLSVQVLNTRFRYV